MQLVTYVLVLGVLAAVFYVIHGRATRVRTIVPRTRIVVCVAWSEEGVPPVVPSLIARATYAHRLSFVVCAPRARETTYPVTFVAQSGWSGEALSHKQCVAVVREDWVLCVPARAGAVEGWDAALEHAWESVGDARAVLSGPAHAKPSFLRIERVGTRGVHTSAHPMAAYKPVRTALFTHAMHFGPRERFACMSLLSPSSTTSDTASSWQLHAAGWSVYTCPAVVVGETEPAAITWHVRSGVDTPQAQSWRTLADLGGPRGRLGLVQSPRL